MNEQVAKILKGAGIAALTAVVLYVSNLNAEEVLGPGASATVVMIAGAVINMVRVLGTKYLSDKIKPEDVAKVVILCLVFAGGSAAISQELPAPVKQSAIYTVFVEDGPYRGSGVYLGDGLYLSAWHVVENNDGRQITVTRPKGERYNVSILATDKESDIALLESKDKPAGGVQVASDEVAKGHEVYHAGLSKGKIVAWRGSVVSYGSRGGGGVAAWAFTRGVRSAIPGDSGGPVFDARGRLLGPLWGGVAQTRETVFSRPTRTLAILSPYRVRLNVWHGVSE